MTSSEIPTPALVLHADRFERNLQAMARLVQDAGKQLRPHAKAHKCVEIARRQIAAGATGVCVATVPEAELMVRSGIRGVLLTSPLADPLKMRRIADLAAVDQSLIVVVDCPQQARMYDALGVTLNVLVDLDVGDHRTGSPAGKPALNLARQIADSRNLNLKGIQAYSVKASHVEGITARRDFSHQAWAAAIHTAEQFRNEGFTIEILTGGSTGSVAGDILLPQVTEVQAGSYVFMDADYARIGGLGFEHALEVLATVVSANHADRVTLDAGFKAFATDRTFGPTPLSQKDVSHGWAGDEFSFLFAGESSYLPALGDRVSFVPPHCDPTVNLHDRIWVCRGNEVEDSWPIMM
jgi:3-hydroxy-D-aspartate aldolase